MGHPIGTISNLTDEQLEARLEVVLDSRRLFEDGRSGTVGRRFRVLVAGCETGEMLRDPQMGFSGAEIAGSFDTFEEMRLATDLGAADLLIIESPTFFADMIPEIQELIKRTSAVRAVVIYRYTQSKTAELIDKDIAGVTALKAPVDIGELRLACQAEIEMAAHSGVALGVGDEEVISGEVPKRLFSDIQIAKASKISSTIDCECPKHLGGLLADLTAFEKYSAECEDRSPEDAELHEYLHKTTARVRSIMETALHKVLIAEGIDLR